MSKREHPAGTDRGRPCLRDLAERSLAWAVTRAFLGKLLEAFRDLLPILLVIGIFQGLVLRQPLPDPWPLVEGLGLVLLGLTLFVIGLEQGLFPVGEAMAQAFARKASLFWLLAFAFCLGFGTTVAEPALIAVAGEASKTLAATGRLADDPQAMASFALRLRLVVAAAVGLAIMIGVIRLLKGWSIPLLVGGGYALIALLTAVSPREIVGIAYDSGGVTTSTVTVPLVTALGVGLAASIRGRNPLIDGFGLIALASILPILFVLAFGILVL